MTVTELKQQIATNLQVPVTEVAKILNSFTAVIDFFSALANEGIPLWSSELTFQTDGSDDGKYCQHPDTNGKLRVWETKIANNTANEPPINPATTEDTNWKEVTPSSAAAIPEWQPGLFGPGLVIVFHNHSVDGRGLYVLLEPVRPFTSANIETEIIAGQWEKIAGGNATQLTNVEVSVVAGTPNLVTFDMAGTDQRRFVTTSAITVDITLAFANAAAHIVNAWSFECTNTIVITMPSETITTGTHGWDNTNKQLTLDPGKYTLSFLNRGSEKELSISGPLDGVSAGGDGITETSSDVSKTLTPVNGTHFFNGSADATWTMYDVTKSGIRKTFVNISSFTLRIQGASSGQIRAGAVVDFIDIQPEESYTFHTNGTYHVQIS